MVTQEEFDSRVWLNGALGPHGKRTERMESILHILECAATNHVYKKWLGPKAKQLTREQVIACAKILGVPNPFEDPEMQVPPGYAVYKFYGSVEAGTLQEPDMTCQDDPKPALNIRHPIYPNATPMAWTVSGDSMNISVPDGSVAFGVDFQETSGTPLNNDLVVVEHILDGRIERTLKRIKLTDAGIELHPESTNPKYRPLILKSVKKGDSEIRIRSLIHRTDKDQNQRRS